MRVLVEETGPAVDLQWHVGDLDFGQHRLDHGAQLRQRGWLLDGVEGAGDNAVVAFMVLDAQLRVGGEPGSGPPPGIVEGTGELGDHGGGVRIQGEVLTSLIPLCLPGIG